MDLDRLEDYKEAVVQAYKMKVMERTLPPNLADPTTANLKNECIAVFNKRYTARDSETFKALFEERSTATEYYKVLTISKADKFKPLSIFLKKKNANGITHLRYIEMLAFLIDFEFRPHRPGDMVKMIERESLKDEPQNETQSLEEDLLALGQEAGELQETKNIDSTDETITTILDPEGETLNENDQETGGTIGGTKTPDKFKKTFLAFIATLGVICSAYVYYFFSSHQCMYWKNDHYEGINCFERIDGPTPIPFDDFILKHQKKITDLKTITTEDIGKVHYSKEHGEVTFYMIGGDNPEDHRKRLLPMTEYMYNKYVKKKQ